MENSTAFASPERLPVPEVRAQLTKVRADSHLAPALDGIGDMIAVVNQHRQVVFANRAFTRFASGGSPEELCGMRPGEILRCIHAESAPAGCGTAAECSVCGAVGAILDTQRSGRPATAECRICVDAAGREVSLDLLVRTTPFEIDGTSFILLCFSDISGEKRRSALERVFFHDILNTASGLKAYLDLLKAASTDPESRALAVRLESICDTLVEEIQGQKVLVTAENRTLTVRKDLIESRSLLRQLVGQFEGLEIARGRTVSIASSSEGLAFVSDDSLVKRILGNMLKNALEASPVGATVTVACRRAADIPGGGVLFSVHNSGFIPWDAQRQVFRRYFSTKGGDRGLGTYGMKLLGEEYLGGSVRFESTEPEGTVFTLLLPLHPPGLGVERPS